MWKKYLPLGIVLVLIVVGGAVWFVARPQQAPISQINEESLPANPAIPQAVPAEPGGGGVVEPVPPVPVGAEQAVPTTLPVNEKESTSSGLAPAAPIPVPAGGPAEGVPSMAPSAAPPAPALAPQQQIQYNGSSFSPKLVTVKKGETVTFVNNGKNPMWVASAMHPTHTVYPTKGGCLGSTFDACRGYEPGSSWSFTFDEVGTWGYHDHLNAGAFGKVVVEK